MHISNKKVQSTYLLKNLTFYKYRTKITVKIVISSATLNQPLLFWTWPMILTYPFGVCSKLSLGYLQFRISDQRTV